MNRENENKGAVSRKPEGVVALITANIGGEERRYIYLAHTSEPFGFSVACPENLDLGHIETGVIDVGAAHWGIWQDADDLAHHFKRYAEAHGNDMKIMSIIPVYAHTVLVACGEPVKVNG